MQTLFKDYLSKCSPKETEAYELKIVRSKSLPFSAVKDHQVEALLKAEDGFFHKLTDPPVFKGMNTRFNSRRPFDCFFLVKASAYLVIWFYEPRKEKVFVKLGINDFLRLRGEAKRKSLTKEEAFANGELLYL